MNLPRLKPNVLQTIHLPRYLYSQTRYLRTKSASKLRPLQGAFGIPGLPSVGDLRKQVKKEVKQKSTPQDQKIPVVPKFTDDEKPIKESAEQSVIPAHSKGLKEMDEDDIVQNRRLREQEKRLEEFEREQKENKGKSDEERRMAGPDQGVEEKPDNIVYPRDVIGRRFIKEKKPKLKVALYRTKNYMGFIAVPKHRMKMVQASVEIIEEYQKHVHGDKYAEALSACNIALSETLRALIPENVDVKHLALPFPPDAILPTMQLVFDAMDNQVRYSLSDLQINGITTGADFIKHLLNPPSPVQYLYRPTFLYTKLTQIQFPPNVQILSDHQIEKRKRDELSAIKSRQVKIEKQKKETDLIKSIHQGRFEQKIIRSKRRRKERKRLHEQEQAVLQEQQRKEENYSQFYGRVN